MSGYDYNHNEHANSNHNESMSTNGSQTRQQMSNDYANRNRSSSTHNLDISHPTSKTVLLVRQRRALLEQLSCYLCKGYLIDATTIDECMDSFCKSCIVNYLRTNNNCPKCGNLIHKTNPLSTIRCDKVLQDIVFKLVPGLYDNEMKRRRDFYRHIYGLSSDEEDDDDSTSSLAGRIPNLSGEQYGAVTHPKPFYKPTDFIDLSIEPHVNNGGSTIYYDNKRQSIATCFTGNSQQQIPIGNRFSVVDSQQFKTYLRCPAKLTALQLKKFISSKFNICKDDTIHLLYLNESLRDEYSLMDIAYIYDWRRIEHMRLYYIIERDLSNSDDWNEHQIDTRRSKSRSSVGASTQTVKRVCIDPQPKYYEEPQPKSPPLHHSGRSMRSRGEVQTPPKQVSNQAAQSPILRSSGTSSREHSNMEANRTHNINNGYMSRELMALNDHDRSRPSRNSFTSAREEASRSSQDNQAETRSSRKASSVSNEAAPKINPQIIVGPSRVSNSNFHSDNRSINVVGQSRVSSSSQPRDIYNTQRNTQQIIPCTARPLPPIQSGPLSCAPRSSSLVTLASFTQARNNQVVTMSSSAAATITNTSYQNIMGAETTLRFDSANGDPNRLNQVAANRNPSQSNQRQLAFSYVTERGITIVRGLTNRPVTTTTPSSTSNANQISTIRAINSIPALPAPPVQSSSTSNLEVGSRSNLSSSPQSSRSESGHHYQQASSSSSSSSQSSSRPESFGQPSSRHLVKVKPVYKTFVDPTKLKSPNFKKLGYTARH